jgi:hypothetical protein
MTVLAVYGPSMENPIVNARARGLRTARAFPAGVPAARSVGGGVVSRCPVEAGADYLARG